MINLFNCHFLVAGPISDCTAWFLQLFSAKFCRKRAWRVGWQMCVPKICLWFSSVPLAVGRVETGVGDFTGRLGGV